MRKPAAKPAKAKGIVHTHSRADDIMPRPKYVSLWLELTDVVRDRVGAPISMTKLLAAYISYLGGYSIHALHGVISMNAFWLELTAAAIAFGKSTFNFLLSRITRQDTQTETRTFERKETEDTKRIIDERNVADGSPPRSMPPVGAEVPE